MHTGHGGSSSAVAMVMAPSPTLCFEARDGAVGDGRMKRGGTCGSTGQSDGSPVDHFGISPAEAQCEWCLWSRHAHSVS